MPSRDLAYAFTLASMMLSGCLNFIDLDFDPPVPNPRLRPDLAPLAPDQMPATSDTTDPTYFAPIDPQQITFEDGDVSRDKLVTPTVPSMKNTRTPNASARGLLRSPCYWVGGRDPIELRWEFVLPFESEIADPQDLRLAGCARYLAVEPHPPELAGFEPFTRRTLRRRGGEYVTPVGYLHYALEAPVEVQRQRSGLDFPGQDGVGCFMAYSGPGAAQDEVPTGSCSFPGGWEICNPNGCAVAPTSAATTSGDRAWDVVFRARSRLPDHVTVETDGTMTTSPYEPSPWIPLAGPTYRVVETSRVFRAELTLDPEASTLRDELVYRWSMPTTDRDGVAIPQANFHPSLDSNVRFYVQREGRVVPISPRRVVAVSPSGPPGRVDCLPNMASGHTHDRLRSCQNATSHNRLNPVIWDSVLRVGDQPLAWEVTFEYKDDPLAYGPGVYGEELAAPEGEVYMEFTIFESSYAPTSADAFRVTPSRINFGATKKSGTKPTIGWFENLTNNTLVIEGARLDGGQSFTLTALPFPFNLGPGQSFQFEVSVAPGTGAMGTLQDMLHFDLRAGPQQYERSVKLLAEAAEGPVADVAPTSMILWSQPGEPSEHQRTTRAMLIANIGTHTFTREPIVIDGPDANAFTVNAASPSPLDNPAVSTAVPSGASSTFQVTFTPQHGGRHEATLRIKSDAENGPEHLVALDGYAP